MMDFDGRCKKDHLQLCQAGLLHNEVEFDPPGKDFHLRLEMQLPLLGFISLNRRRKTIGIFEKYIFLSSNKRERPPFPDRLRLTRPPL